MHLKKILLSKLHDIDSLKPEIKDTLNDVSISIIKEDLPDNILIKDSNLIYIDIETNGLNINRDRICKIQIFIPDIKKVYILDVKNGAHKEQYPVLCKLLQANNLKIFHYAELDVLFLQKTFDLSINFKCTSLMSKIARTYSGSHSLKTLCSEFCSVELNKSNQQSYWGVDAENLSENKISYMVADVIYLPYIYHALLNVLKKEKRITLVDHAMIWCKKTITLHQEGFPIETLIRFSNHHHYAT